MGIRWRAVAIFLAVAIVAGASMGQAAARDAAYLHLKGAINKAAEFEAWLCVDGQGNATGYGMYAAAGVPIVLSGEIDAKGMLEIDEYTFDTGDKSGRFAGSLVKGLAKGTWTSGDAAKSLPFELKEDYLSSTAFLPLYYLETQPFEGESAELGMATYSRAYLSPKADKKLAALIESEVYGGKKAKVCAEEGASAFFARYQEETADLLESFPDAPYLDWYSDGSLLVIAETPTLISMVAHYEYFEGGAHPNRQSQLFVFDKKEGKRLKLADVVAASARPALADKIKAALASKLDAGESLESAGFYIEEIQGTDNFFVTPAGIGFFFDPYAIGPYALGSFQVFLKWADLKGIAVPR